MKSLWSAIKKSKNQSDCPSSRLNWGKSAESLRENSFQSLIYSKSRGTQTDRSLRSIELILSNTFFPFHQSELEPGKIMDFVIKEGTNRLLMKHAEQENPGNNPWWSL